MRTTPYYYSLADRIDSGDPIATQFLPAEDEDVCSKSSVDPLGELQFHEGERVIHRYRNRAVLLATDTCAVRCRHCTRRNTLGSLSSGSSLRDGLSYLRSHQEIREVLVSGGDPLCLDDQSVHKILTEIQAIEHVKVVRIGTRAPVVLPMRITDDLCSMLARHRPLWLNTQFNHPREVTAEAAQACERLLQCGIPVSNQTVLMKGVNDNIDTMRELCEALNAIMVRPYYVFLCDRVRGTERFWTSREEAVEMSTMLRQELAGLSCPLFVEDIPGRKSKVPL